MTKAASPADPNHSLHVGFESFKARRRTTLACVVRDRTYGTMQVHMVPSQITARDQPRAHVRSVVAPRPSRPARERRT